jgi:hypothetical protein
MAFGRPDQIEKRGIRSTAIPEGGHQRDRADVKKARLVLDLQGRGGRAFALRAYRRDHVNVFPFLSRDDKPGRFALPDQDTA